MMYAALAGLRVMSNELAYLNGTDDCAAGKRYGTQGLGRAKSNSDRLAIFNYRNT
jgi:hypothetical protein